MSTPRNFKLALLGIIAAIGFVVLRTQTVGPAKPTESNAGIGAEVHAADGTASGQPIAFPHKTHIENQVECLFCHEYADKSRVAGIPSVDQCMTCHQAIKADSPEIIKLALFAQRREEVPWRRVYQLPKEAHVYFTHKRHIRAGVTCATCHGDVAGMQTAEHAVNQTMGWCIECHRANESKFSSPKLATDCLTCHN